MILRSNGQITASNAFFNGDVVAASFAETFVIVNSGNKSLYIENYDGNSKSRLIFDGSGGGDVIRVMQLNVAPDHDIHDLILPGQGSSVSNEVQIIINVDGVVVDDGSIANSMANFAK